MKQFTKTIIKTILLIILFFISITLNKYVQAVENTKTTTIVLNAGHGGEETGAVNRSKGLVEKTLNLKISNYLEEELKKYYDVKVIQTHDGVTFPKNNCHDLAARAMIARKNNADLYVSLHINDAATKTKNGASVYVTSRKELPKYNEGMTKLANKILKNLSNIGIKTEGVHTKLCIDDSPDPKYRYYDKKLADYYGDIRYAMKGDTSDYGANLNDGSGIPTVLIEHCYINNSDDLKFLDSDEDLKKLAQADAKAIVEYLQLKLPSEIVPSITVDKEQANLFVGDKLKITAAISPINALNKEVKWVSSNESVVTVDLNGNITALSSGKAQITVSLVSNPTLLKTINVQVVELSPNTKIDITKYKLNDKYISKIGEKISSADFLKNINISDNLEVSIQMPNKGQKYIGTNTKVIIKEKQQHFVVKEYQCLVYGDVNGDGEITPADYVKIKNHIMKVSTLKENNYTAADIDQNKKITPADYVKVKNHIMKASTISI